MDLKQFDEIRCLNNNEIKDAFIRITKQSAFSSVMQYLFPTQRLENIHNRFLELNDIDEFQHNIIYPYLLQIEKNYTQGISAEGIEYIKNAGPCFYISNHRDIILDSALLCKELIENNLQTVEIAIGDNLLIYPWIEDFVRANKSFIVKRGGSVRELLANSQRLSAYIAYTLHSKKSSIWMAQREGRSKNSDDRTQTSLLKMLNMSGTGSFLENMEQLNICPVAISYEYDPCDYLKAKEFQQKRDNPNFKKSPKDDLINMKTGVLGKKGRVVFCFTPSINSELKTIATNTQIKNEQIELTATLIDQHIHSNYAIFSGNKVAYDLYFETDRFATEYTAQEKQTFEDYITQQVAKIDLENKDEVFLKHKILEMYANPLKNKLIALECK